MDQGFDSNGKRQTARLPFTSGGLSGGQSLGSQRFNQNDVYATRIGDDFDDVLDVPIQQQSGYQAVDDTPPVPVFEDVFTSGQNQDQPSPYDFAAYDKPSAPLDAFANPGARQREPQDYIEPAEQEFVGWPVLPEGPEEEEEEARSGRGGLFLRLGLIVGLFGVVCFWAYYFLGDFINKRRLDRSSAQTTESTANAGASTRSSDQPTEPSITPNTTDDKSVAGSDPITPEPPPPNTKAKAPVSVPPAPKTEGNPKSTGIVSLPKPPPSRGVELSSRGGLTVQVGSFKDSKIKERLTRTPPV